MSDAPRPTGRLIGKKAAPPEAPSPRLGQPQVTYPRSEWCQACARTTTHVRQGCTRCMGKGDNRKQGALFLAVGAALVALGLGLGYVGVNLASSSTTHRPRRGGVPYLALLALVGGLSLGAKGAQALLTGSDPEAEV